MTLRTLAMALAAIAIMIAAYVSYTTQSWMPLIMAGSIGMVVIAGSSLRPRP